MDVKEVIKKRLEDYKWFESNFEKLKKVYKDKWIAIKDKKVIESDKYFLRLIKKLRDKNIDTRFVLIEQLYEEVEVMVPTPFFY